MKYLPAFLMFVLGMTGCQQQEARRQFRAAVVAMKVCAQNSTAKEWEFHHCRADLENCFEVNRSHLAQFLSDFQDLQRMMEATDIVWVYFESSEYNHLYGEDDTKCWPSVLIISPEMIDKPKNLKVREIRKDPSYWVSTHVAAGRGQTAIKCSALLTQLE